MKVKAIIKDRAYSTIHKGITTITREENITIIKTTDKTVTFIDSIGRTCRKAKHRIAY